MITIIWKPAVAEMLKTKYTQIHDCTVSLEQSTDNIITLVDKNDAPVAIINREEMVCVSGGNGGFFLV